MEVSAQRLAHTCILPSHDATIYLDKTGHLYAWNLQTDIHLVAERIVSDDSDNPVTQAVGVICAGSYIWLVFGRKYDEGVYGRFSMITGYDPALEWYSSSEFGNLCDMAENEFVNTLNEFKSLAHTVLFVTSIKSSVDILSGYMNRMQNYLKQAKRLQMEIERLTYYAWAASMYPDIAEVESRDRTSTLG